MSQVELYQPEAPEMKRASKSYALGTGFFYLFNLYAISFEKLVKLRLIGLKG